MQPIVEKMADLDVKMLNEKISQLDVQELTEALKNINEVAAQLKEVQNNLEGFKDSFSDSISNLFKNPFGGLTSGV